MSDTTIPEFNLSAPLPETTSLQSKAGDSVTLSKSDFDSIMNRISQLETAKTVSGDTLNQSNMEALLKGLNALAASNQKEVNPRIGYLPTQVENVDPDDVLEKPITFFSFGWTFAIVDDTRNGTVVLTPFGRIIKFRNIYRNMVPSTSGSRNKQAVSLCAVSIFSKKEAEWLRNHRKFNVSIFEETEKALSIENYELADYIANQRIVLERKQVQEIMHMCTAEGIEVHTRDRDHLISALARKLGEKTYQSQRKGAKMGEGVQLVESRYGNGPVQATDNVRQ